MTDEERASVVLENVAAGGPWAKKNILHLMEVVRAEEREKAAKEAEANLTCCGHGAFNECDHKAAADEIAAAIRARGQA